MEKACTFTTQATAHINYPYHRSRAVRPPKDTEDVWNALEELLKYSNSIKPACISTQDLIKVLCGCSSEESTGGVILMDGVIRFQKQYASGISLPAVFTELFLKTPELIRIYNHVSALSVPVSISLPTRSNMRQPNGYGSVYKLSGKRRKPWCVRVTQGWDIDTNTGKVIQIRKIVGTYATQKDAMIALADFNKNPYDLNLDRITFAELYEKWSDVHFPKVSESNVKGYRASYRLCTKIESMKITDIKLDHLQMVVDESGKNTPTLKKLKILFGLMYDYAVMHEICTQDKRDMVRYVDISQAGNPNSYNRKPFTKAQVKTVWKWKDSSPYIRTILMLIYSGCRISELLDLKKCDVNLDEKWFRIVQAKTEAGVRTVPINDKVLPFFQEWYDMNDCEYLLSTPDGKHFEYRNYYDSYWLPFMEQMNMKHTPHETRHTCISLLTSAGVDERIIKKIVGHKGQGVTQTVYTHFEIEELLDAINKI